MRKSSVVLAVVASLVSAAWCQAAMIVVSPLADASIYRDAPENANGRGAGLFAGNNANQTTATRRGLIRFDVSSVPAGAVVTGVSLRMYVDQENTQKGPLPVTLHRLTSNWSEGPTVGSGGGAGAVAGDATWDFATFNTSAWTTAGGDYIAEDSATTLVGGEGQFYTWTGSGLVGDVNAWLADPTSNDGWIVRADESQVRTAKRFVSREGTVVDQRPLLTVEYAVVPEPGALGLVALAGLGLRRRK